MGLFKNVFGANAYSNRELKRIEPIKNKVLELDEEYQELSDAELKAKTAEFKERLEDGETLDDILPEALATVREAAWRVLEKKPYPVQAQTMQGIFTAFGSHSRGCGSKEP